MATIPRYQELGVQYADLPKVSTALQQARATGFDQLSRSLDRMTSYLQGERETQVKKEAIKYAVDNPITSEQLEAALKDPKALQIQGAGQVFQETYQAYAVYEAPDTPVIFDDCAASVFWRITGIHISVQR